MKKTQTPIIVVGIILVALAGIIAAFSNAGKPQATVYCGSDGKLTTAPAIQSHRSYCIQSNAPLLSLWPNIPAVYSFSIVDDQGNILKDFEIEHEKFLHLVIVRKDLQEFQHVHPALNRTTGQFTLSDLTFPAPGDYRIFADFTPALAHASPDAMPLGVTIFEDVRVAGAYIPQPLGSAERNTAADGYDIVLTSVPKDLAAGMNMVSFAITRNGKPVSDLQEYLGALGHSVILKEGTLEYIHTHALEEPGALQNGVVSFHVAFPSVGNYKVFTQFQHEDKAVTADFVLSVSQTGNMMPQDMRMDHPAP